MRIQKYIANDFKFKMIYLKFLKSFKGFSNTWKHSFQKGIPIFQSISLQRSFSISTDPKLNTINQKEKKLDFEEKAEKSHRIEREASTDEALNIEEHREEKISIIKKDLSGYSDFSSLYEKNKGTLSVEEKGQLANKLLKEVSGIIEGASEKNKKLERILSVYGDSYSSLLKQILSDIIITNEKKDPISIESMKQVLYALAHPHTDTLSSPFDFRLSDSLLQSLELIILANPQSFHPQLFSLILQAFVFQDYLPSVFLQYIASLQNFSFLSKNNCVTMLNHFLLLQSTNPALYLKLYQQAFLFISHINLKHLTYLLHALPKITMKKFLPYRIQYAQTILQTIVSMSSFCTLF